MEVDPSWHPHEERGDKKNFVGGGGGGAADKSAPLNNRKSPKSLYEPLLGSAQRRSGSYSDLGDLRAHDVDGMRSDVAAAADADRDKDNEPIRIFYLLENPFSPTSRAYEWKSFSSF